MKVSGKRTLPRISLTLAVLCWISCFTVSLSSVAQTPGEIIFAVTIGNKLLSIDSSAPIVLRSTALISGLQSGETILGIDFRPRTGRLLALGSTSRLYSINTATGAATQVGTTQFNPELDGTAFGFDFNPVADRIRVVSDSDTNLRLNPETGDVAAADSLLAYNNADTYAEVNPNIVAAAYSDSLPGATVTTLYGIDYNFGTVVRQGSSDGAPISPNSGQLFTVGPLGVKTTAEVGFDVGAFSGVAYASLTSQGTTSSSLYTVNLSTGATTLLGTIGGTEVIRDIAVASPAITIASVSAASFRAEALASESIVIAFGTNLATRNVSAVSTPLPLTIAGTTVKVRDSARVERFAPLFSVAPNQLLYQMPPGTAPGPAIITVTNVNGTISYGVTQIARLAPGLFAANANGRDAAFAQVLRVRADGSQRYEPATQFSPALGRAVTLPIDLGPESDQVFLVLAGTGIRFFSSLSAVTVTLGGTNVPVLFAGAQPTFVGVDQINVLLLRSLIGRGEMDVVLMVDGITANTVRINVK